MKITTVKTVIIFLTLMNVNVAISGGTIQKCVDEKGHITFTERCATNQQGTDTGMEIDARSEKQKAEDNANIQKHLENVEKQSKITPTATATPIAQPNPADTTLTPDETTDYDNDDYECLSSSRNCLGLNGGNLTPAQKAAIINRAKAVQLPARIKRR